ncbi:type II secretory pathway, component HofQ [Synechococcus sp. PCC 7502]|uniref:type II secretory pathway, component HofQ n=1 Tax=Synechococcus sp. PCC 7502 TaxID=1173263 RepID=UPI00029FB159|nr:type II secretory pathway, component HofQ [Synechococcus sp. PCC 7502]AFY72746.1 type II secretory pathway, component HofQ [Synechococcus sp. PCC 7502]
MNTKLLFCSLALTSVCPQILLAALPSEASNEVQADISSLSLPVRVAQATTPDSKNSPIIKPLFESKVTITDANGKPKIAQAKPTTTPTLTSPSINSKPLPGAVQGIVPPFQRRPIPAPSGDISIGTFSIKPDTIDLGSAERVPRISLREAPVRDVLTLIARVAGLNVAFADDSAPGTTTTAATSGGPRVSLDIENETAQDVFNSVLRLSNLDASRIGKTIFVAAKLPINLKNIVTRSYRLNQVSVGEASGFLLGLGAERTVNRQRPVPGVTTAQVGTAGGITNVTIPTETIPTLESLTPSANSILPLRGLQIAAEERNNSITLIGAPSLVDYAAAQLGRLDARKRQVSVNVRIVDVTLQGNQIQTASSSFGINDTFFTFDNGAAVVNFGQNRPSTAGDASTNLFGRPVITNPITGTPFINPATIDPTTGLLTSVLNSAISPLGSGNPLQPGITNVTPGTPPSGNTSGTPTTVTFSLPTLFQYPSQFLARLQSNIQNGTAKILTDPILTVQEGETAQVSLTQDVLVGTVQNQTTINQVTTTTVQPNIQQAGLTLNINIARVDDNGFINLSISPSVTAPSQIVRLGNGDTASLLSRRTLTSGQIRLRDNQTLIISGVIQDLDRETVSKVPFLGDLPIIGALFRSQQTEKTRNEVVIVVTPRILDDSDRSQFGYTYQPGAEVTKILENNRVPANPPQN